MLFNKTKTKKTEAKGKKVVVKKEIGSGGQDASANYFDIFRKPRLTEKASIQAGLNKYVFEVSKSANKPEIKKAIENIFKVKVSKINMSNFDGKKVKMGRYTNFKPSWKKAVITLKEGDKIEVGV